MEFWNAFVFTVKNGRILQIFVVCLALVLTLNDVRLKRRQVLFGILRVFALFIVTLLLSIVSDLITNHIEGVRSYIRSFIYSLLQTLTAGLYAWLFSKYNWRVKLLVTAEILASSFTLNEFGAAVGLLMQRATEVDPMVFRVIGTLFVVIIAVLINRFHVRQFDGMATGGSTVVSFALMILCTGITFSGILNDGLSWNYTAFAASAYIFLYAVEIGIYFMFYYICREHVEKIGMLLEKNLAEIHEGFLDVSGNMLSEIRKLRHDLKNQYAYMELLLDRKEYEELKEYFSKLKGTSYELMSSFVDCGNKCVSAILNIKKANAEANGFAFDYDINIPSELPFADIDMCSILTNLLDNAIEAMERDGLVGGKIGIEMTQKGDYLYITVKNPVSASGDEGGLTGLISRKKNATLHGFGTKIVKSIAEKYNGAAKFSVADGEFCAMVMLDMFAKKDK